MNKEVTSASAPIRRRLAAAALAVAVTLSFVALVGWYSGNLDWAAWREGSIPMAPSTALFFIALSAASFMARKTRRAGGARILAWVLVAIALLELSPIGPRIEGMILPAMGDYLGVPMGRMAGSTAVCLFLSALALALMTLSKLDASDGGKLCAIFSGSAATVAVAIYLVKNPFAGAVGLPAIPMALPTAVSLVFLNLHLLAAHARGGALLANPTGATHAKLLRHIIPAVVGGCLLWRLLEPALREFENLFRISAFFTGFFEIFFIAACVTVPVAAVARMVGREIDRGLRRERDFRALRDSMNEIVVFHEIIRDESGRAVDSRMTACNSAFTRVFGIPREGASGAILFNMCEPPFFETCARVADSGVSESVESAFSSLGRRFLISLYSPERDRFALVMTDITEQEIVMAALRREEELSRVILDSMDDAVLAFDAEGRLNAANRRALEWFGVKGILSLRMRSGENYLFHPPDGTAPMEGEKSPLIRSLRGEDIRNREAILKTVHFPHRSIVIDGGPIFDMWNLKLGSVLVLRDMSAEKALFQSQKLAALGRMAAGVAHELSQPLNTIKSSCQAMLLNRSEGISMTEEEMTEQLRLMDEQSARMDELIRNMRGLSRQDAGIEEELVDVNSLLSFPLARLQKKRLEEKAIEVHIEVNPGPLFVRGNERRLQQVVVNLFVNAVDAVEERKEKDSFLNGPHVVLKANLSGDRKYALLTVTDAGTGIGPVERERLFEPFFTTKGPDRGLGLGLTISRDIVLHHGGSLEASSFPGHGSIFTVALPAVGPQEAKPGLPERPV